MTIFETITALRSGELDLMAYVSGLCDRIEKEEHNILAMIPGTYDRKRVCEAASQLLESYPEPRDRPPLFGIPLGVKDIINVSGFPTKCGSDLPAAAFDGQEADCISSLKRAGIIIMGKTVTTEFAYFEPGPTRNPHNPNHTPGGSSSGSAAGVASGFFPFALGSQTGGSVIRPAAYCGVVGFKPSFGRIPIEGVMPLSETLDHLGILCADHSGIDPIMQILDIGWNSGASRKYSDRLVLGVPDGPYLNLANPHGLQYFEMTLKKLLNNDYQIKRITTLSDIDVINDNHLRLMHAEIARAHAEWYNEYGHLYGAKMSDGVLQGQTVGDDEIETLRAETFKFRGRVEEQMKSEGIDAWICPPTQDSAPEGLSSTGSPIMNFSWTHGGLPCLTFPSGNDEAGLPHGVQIVGYFGKDEELVASSNDLHETLNGG